MTAWIVGGAFLAMLAYLRWEDEKMRELDKILDIAEFSRMFDRIPVKGPVQDETKLSEPDEAEVARRIEAGRNT